MSSSVTKEKRTSEAEGSRARTYQPNGDVGSAWWLVDAAGLIEGRLATEVARLLQGKHKPQYAPNRDVGDHVVVVNAEHVVISGKKLDSKFVYHHSGYPGGLSKTSYRQLFEREPEELIRRSVRGMMPKSRLGKNMLRKLRVYAGPSHPHDAQKPVPYRIPFARSDRLRKVRSSGALPQHPPSHAPPRVGSARSGEVGAAGGRPHMKPTAAQVKQVADLLFPSLPRRGDEVVHYPETDDERRKVLQSLRSYFDRRIERADSKTDTT